MKDRQMQQMMSQVVADAPLVPDRSYHLCWWQNQIQCRPVRHTKDAHEVFYSAPGYVFLDGLSLHQWRLTTTRVADFCRRNGIILDLESGRRQEANARPAARRRITEFDALRLRGLVANAETQGFGSGTRLDKLQRVLRQSDVVEPRNIPEDVVTMNSEVRLRNEDAGVETTLALVFPADARDRDPEKLKLSIFTETGLSILGRRAGDTIDGRLKIVGLPYQPEAAGDFYL
jgi:regulator of nucleoside diphosphate kinase